MRNFTYTALTSSGAFVEGEIQASDLRGALSHLHQKSLLPIDASEKQKTDTARKLRWWRNGRTLPASDLKLMSQQLARLLKAGLALDRALVILIDLTESQRLKAALQEVLDRVRDGHGFGESLSVAGHGWAFSRTFVSLTSAGEESGALEGVLSQSAIFIERSEALRQATISAMIYPVILMIAAGLSVGLILVGVLPQFEPIFRDAGSRLPLSTRVVIATGDILRERWWVLLIALVAGVFAGRAALRDVRIRERWDRLALMLPIVGSLVTRFEVARFCRTFGVMLTSGVPASRGLEFASKAVTNMVLVRAINDSAKRFAEGEGLASPLNSTGRFPSTAIQLIRIGEETGRLDHMLGEIAEIYDQEVHRSLDRLLALLVPALTLGMGLVIAFIVAAVMMALMSVNALAL